MRHYPRKDCTAVVFGAQHPTGLMTARALRDCGLKIIGVCFSDSPCLSSNLWDTVVRAEKTAEDIVEKLEVQAAETDGTLLLFPADDECVKIISDHRHRLPARCHLVLPDVNTVDLLLDKSKFYGWAQRHGFSFPATASVHGFPELDQAITDLGYPLLLKPLCRGSAWDKAFPSDKVFILRDEADRLRLPGRIFDVASPVLVQQWVPGGDDEIYFCLVHYSRDGRLTNYFCGRKLMQWPPQGGSTAIAVSDEREETRELTVAIFNKLGYRGLGSIEYKKDPRSGKFYIMEPTVGRNDFQSYLACSGGVNLTMGLCLEMLGEVYTPSVKRPAAWFCEPSVCYALKYYLRRRDSYFLKHLSKLARTPGFAYLATGDIAPFLELVKARFRQ